MFEILELFNFNILNILNIFNIFNILKSWAGPSPGPPAPGFKI